MAQLIYAFLAMLMVMLLSLNMQRGIHATEYEMYVNEVATQLTGVGVDIMEHIGRMPFDDETDESEISPLTYPVITSPNALTPEGGTEWGNCPALGGATNPDECDDIDDFDGLTADIEVDGFTYTVEVDVHYVNPTNPTMNSGTQTYAKEVTLTITNPYLLLGDDPLTVEMQRVFTYTRHTS